MTAEKSLTIFAPAKINLFLHITGRRSNGYHDLDSLVTFADIGDLITIEKAKSFSFHVIGEFAKNFKENESSSFLDGNNLVTKAARTLSQITDRALNVKITLTKNLPIASGIGGGSSDAAATIWGLQEFWGLNHDAPYINDLLIKLGADVPACYEATPRIMRRTGDLLLPAPSMPEIPILLINPMISCSTEDIFLHYNGKFKKDTLLPSEFNCIFDLIVILQQLENDLSKPAIKLIPEIENVINAFNAQDHCLLSRMSGSGASCFAIFETIEGANKASKDIKLENPDWWIKLGWLNRVERY